MNQLRFIHDMCEKYDIMFKINTVVCSVNWQEDLSDMIETLDPVRWKVFQCLLIEGRDIFHIKIFLTISFARAKLDHMSWVLLGC